MYFLSLLTAPQPPNMGEKDNLSLFIFTSVLRKSLEDLEGEIMF